MTEFHATLIPPYRLPRRALGDRWKMKIMPQFIDCVAFICARGSTDKNSPGGTAFFMEVEDESDPSQKWTYLVTTLHSLDEIRGRDVYVRVNTLPVVNSRVGFKDLLTRKDDWVPHWSADVAAILMTQDLTSFSCQRIPIELCVRADYRMDLDAFEKKGNTLLGKALKATYKNGIPVDVGDELFFPGLFVQSAGKNRNLPIVRFGSISRMPGDELVRIESSHSSKQIRAYLAESLSWGGHSGSPVFWLHEYNFSALIKAELWQEQSQIVLTPSPPPQKVEVKVATGWVIGFLGLISAHFDIEAKAKKFDDVITAINAGIAAITPAENIRELLMSDEMKDDRRNRLEEMKRSEPVATADFVSAKRKARKIRDVAIQPTSRGHFFGALKKATRRKEPSS